MYRSNRNPTIAARTLTAVLVAEVLFGIAPAVGLFRVFTAWTQLLVNDVSTFASWRQIIDPWGMLGLGRGGRHLFLASIVITAASIVLVLNARDDTFTLDRWLGRTCAVREPAARTTAGVQANSASSHTNR